MGTIVKLQKIGNSIRATIPREVLKELSLRQGEEVLVTVLGDVIVLKKKQQARDLTRFYGILEKKTGKVERWPSPQEIKAIWE